MDKRYYRKSDPTQTGERIVWVEMTGREYYRFITDPANRGRFFIDMDDVVLEATREEFRAYKSEQDHRDYLNEQEEGWGLVSIYAGEAEDAEGIGNLEDVIASGEEAVEKAALREILLQQLRYSVAALPAEERWLIDAFYLSPHPMTTRQLSIKTGLPVMTLHNRKAIILEKLGVLTKVEKTFGTNAKKVRNRK